MSEAPKSSAMLNRVMARLKLAAWGRTAFVVGLAVVTVAAVALITIRLLGLLTPEQQDPLWLLSVPVIIAAVTALLHRRHSLDQAAQAVDQHLNAHDLFLTLTRLDSSAGQFQPLVVSAAEEKAEMVNPPEVVPFQFGRRLGILAGSFAVLMLASLFFPQLDPFGTIEAAEAEQEQVAELAAMRRANEEQRKSLEREALIEKDRSDELDQQLEGMKNAFREMKKDQQKKNSQVLQQFRSNLDSQWKMLSSDDLRSMMNQTPSSQEFGSRGRKMNEWLKDLQAGKTDSLEQELQEAKSSLEKMMGAKSEEERKAAASELKRKLQDLRKFASEKAGSKDLANQLDKAMKALEAAQQACEKNGEGQQGEMGQQAMQALQESLELTEKEMQQLAQAAQDMQELQEALETLQRAQQLNEQEALDGSQCEGCQSMADYAEFYKQQMGQNSGMGTGGEGMGEGGEVPEDDSDPEGYKDEKSKAQILAGKVLLSIRTKENADEKDFDPEQFRQYQEQVQAVQSGVDAAIEAEQVPPGYVDAIKNYFGNMNGDSGK